MPLRTSVEADALGLAGQRVQECLDDQRDAGHAEADIEQREQHSREAVRVMKVEFRWLVGDDHDHADFDDDQAERNDDQHRKGQNGADVPKQKPPAGAVGIMQPSEGDGHDRYHGGQHPQYSGHRSGSRNKEYQHADRNEEQHGEPKLASAGTPPKLHVADEKTFDGINETAVVVGRPCAVAAVGESHIRKAFFSMKRIRWIRVARPPTVVCGHRNMLLFAHSATVAIAMIRRLFPQYGVCGRP